jgi:hypothetical protein
MGVFHGNTGAEFVDEHFDDIHLVRARRMMEHRHAIRVGTIHFEIEVQRFPNRSHVAGLRRGIDGVLTFGLDPAATGHGE